jgi:pimeloyl-ACP methyl ester carboxylesterase
MYNYWQRLKAQKDESYQVASLVGLLELTGQLILAALQGKSFLDEFVESLGEQPGIIVDLPNLTVQTVTFGASDESDGLELIPTNLPSIDVVGHSLGGHLAMAFTRLFPESNPTAYTVNAAGFGPQFNVDNLLNALAGAITNFDVQK